MNIFRFKAYLATLFHVLSTCILFLDEKLIWSTLRECKWIRAVGVHSQLYPIFKKIIAIH